MFFVPDLPRSNTHSIIFAPNKLTDNNKAKHINIAAIPLDHSILVIFLNCPRQPKGAYFVKIDITTLTFRVWCHSSGEEKT